jgi:hypothetical protein
LYIGYGTKTGDVSFNPTTPQPILSDPSEPKEQLEPTPFNAPAAPAPPKADEGEGEAQNED